MLLAFPSWSREYVLSLAAVREQQRISLDNISITCDPVQDREDGKVSLEGRFHLGAVALLLMLNLAGLDEDTPKCGGEP